MDGGRELELGESAYGKTALGDVISSQNSQPATNKAIPFVGETARSSDAGTGTGTETGRGIWYWPIINHFPFRGLDHLPQSTGDEEEKSRNLELC